MLKEKTNRANFENRQLGNKLVSFYPKMNVLANKNAQLVRKNSNHLIKLRLYPHKVSPISADNIKDKIHTILYAWAHAHLGVLRLDQFK